MSYQDHRIDYHVNKNAYFTIKTYGLEQFGGFSGFNEIQITLHHRFEASIVDKYVEKNLDVDEYFDRAKQSTHFKNSTEEDQISIFKPLNIFMFHILKFEFDHPLADDGDDDIKVEFTDNATNNIVIENSSVINGNLIVNFYVINPIDKIVVRLSGSHNSNVSSVKIFSSCYKNADSYIIGPLKPFEHIYPIIQQQYHNRIQIDRVISTIILNELTAEKLSYHKYLIDLDIIPKNTTQVFIRNVDDEYDEIDSKIDDRIENNMVLKYPFHSTSKCVFLPSDKFVDKNVCFKNHGFILQKMNDTLKDVEFKTHYIVGGELYAMVRYKLNDYYFSQKGTSPFDFIQEINNVYKRDMSDLQTRTFDAMNRLRFIKEVRNNHEMRRVYRLVKALIVPYVDNTDFLDTYDVKVWNKDLDKLHTLNVLPSHIREFLKPFTDGENICYFDAMFSSLLTSYKLDRLMELKEEIKSDHKLLKMVDKLINNYKMSDMEFDNHHLKNVTHPILDFYMRIDIAIPDGDHYQKCYVNEIEPLASGKGTGSVVLKYLDDPIVASPTTNILVRAYQSAILKDYVPFEKIDSDIVTN